MTIRKKLILSNILMIIIPLCLSIVVGYVLLDVYESRYWDSFEDMFNDQNGVYSVESLIYAYRDEFFYGEWEKYAEVEDGEVTFSADEIASLRELDQELKDLGYHFQVKVAGDVMYSSLTEGEKQKIDDYFADTYEQIESVVLTDNEASIVKNTFQASNENIEIVAVCSNTEGTRTANQSYLQKHISTFIIETVWGAGYRFNIL